MTEPTDLNWLQVMLAYPWMRGAIAGFAAAALADYAAFRSWKKWSDALTYDWGVASFRWAQGAVVGALTGFGLGETS